MPDNTKNDTQITQVPISKLHAFEGHPYKVLDNDEMDSLTESIRENGVLTPVLVRPLENMPGDYEIIAGHRRIHAAQRAGLDIVPAFIRTINRDAASILLVDSNLHREHILPSEKAFAYKLKLEAIKHQGVASRQVVGKSESADSISDSESGRTVQRYIRLTNLGPKLLDMVDQGRIAFSVGVELSYLGEAAQDYIAEIAERDDITPSYSQASRMHRAAVSTPEQIEAIMAEEKPNQRETVKIRADRLREVLPSGVEGDRAEEFILKACEHYRKYLQRQRDAR
ncbi:MAG: ParB/RepB/Spo0J family partition protein [Oscillospiraceae bacterium]|nr:ParB/RepB/Spo0J family partition protein [Oscillospiraceae bacterium]